MRSGRLEVIARLRSYFGAFIVRLLVAEAAQLERQDPVGAASLLAEAVLRCLLASDAPRALETARRAAALGRDEDPFIALALSYPLVAMRCEGEARPIMLRAADRLEGAEPILFHQALYLLGLCLAVAGEFRRARRLLGRVVGAARANGMPGILPLPLAAQSILDFWTGRWGESYAAGSEAVRLAEGTGVRLGMVLMWVVFIEGSLGLEDDCRVHVATALHEAERSGDVGAACWLHAALGKLELGLGRYPQAVEEFEDADRWSRACGARPVPEWSADRAEAHLRIGRRNDAAVEFAELAQWGRANEHPIALAAAARGRLLLADADKIDEHYREAMLWYERTSTPFEQARARLYYGERLRRAKRLTEAREHLRRALDAFERLGASLWASRARNELRASGAAVGKLPAVGIAVLTPQELQVAVAVANGSTNREAAAALFLSPKTVGFHLGRVYRKLGIRSRVELARLLAVIGGVAGPRT